MTTPPDASPPLRADPASMRRPGRLARVVVRCYPRAFRAAHGEEIAQFVDDRRAEPRYQAGWRGGTALAVALLSDTVRVAGPMRLRALTGAAHGLVRRRRPLPVSGPTPAEEDRMDTLLQDLRYAIRTLSRRPGFAAIAIITLALGIGVNTAVFSAVNAVLLRPLPYPDADRLMVVWGARGSIKPALMALPDVEDLRARNHTFDDIGAYRTQSVNLTGSDRPDRMVGAFLTANVLKLLGATMVRGRGFTPEETPPHAGGGQVAVLSYGAWQGRFGGDTAILGRTLILNGRPHQVIGVIRQGFIGIYGPPDVYLPIASAPNTGWFDRGDAEVWAVGRLNAGRTREDAQRDLHAIMDDLGREYPATNQGADVDVLSLKDHLVGDVRPTLLIALAAVAAVLLIACANIANLQLARATARRREMSVRAALGASRGRLVRQLLTESILVAAAGGVIGVLLAAWALHGLIALVPGGLPSFATVALSGRVLAFSALLVTAAGLLFGAAPAIHAARARLNDSLTVRSADGDGPAGRWLGIDLRNAFVAAELAACIVLLVGAGLLTRSLQSLLAVRPGFDANGVLTAEFRLPQAKYDAPDKIVAFTSRAVGAIRAVPGVRSAAVVSAVPLSGNWSRESYEPEGVPVPPDGNTPVALNSGVSSGFFRTMGIPLIAGRDFDDRDREGAERVAIVSVEFAKRTWPGESAIGRRVQLLDPPRWLTVVGLVGDIKEQTLAEPPTPELYQPIQQVPFIFNSIVAKVDGDPAKFAGPIREAIWSVDRDQPVWRMVPLTSMTENTVAAPRFVMRLTSTFGLLALLLAVVGVYGVMSYVVAQRTREMGIRVALGARQWQIVRMVLARGARVAGVATVIGVAAALPAARLLASQLYQIRPADPVTFVTVPLALAAVALLACWLPARRASRVDPVEALRAE